MHDLEKEEMLNKKTQKSLAPQRVVDFFLALNQDLVSQYLLGNDEGNLAPILVVRLALLLLLLAY